MGISVDREKLVNKLLRAWVFRKPKTNLKGQLVITPEKNCTQRKHITLHTDYSNIAFDVPTRTDLRKLASGVVPPWESVNIINDIRTHRNLRRRMTLRPPESRRKIYFQAVPCNISSPQIFEVTLKVSVLYIQKTPEGTPKNPKSSVLQNLKLRLNVDGKTYPSSPPLKRELKGGKNFPKTTIERLKGYAYTENPFQISAVVSNNNFAPKFIDKDGKVIVGKTAVGSLIESIEFIIRIIPMPECIKIPIEDRPEDYNDYLIHEEKIKKGKIKNKKKG